MEKIVTCPICGAQFETSRPNKKYCSFSCREAGRKVVEMEWKQKHPAYKKEYMREYRKRDGKKG